MQKISRIKARVLNFATNIVIQYVGIEDFKNRDRRPLYKYKLFVIQKMVLASSAAKFERKKKRTQNSQKDSCISFQEVE